MRFVRHFRAANFRSALVGFYPMLCNSASGPEIGFPDRISAGLQSARPQNRRSGRPSAGRRADFDAFPTRIRIDFEGCLWILDRAPPGPPGGPRKTPPKPPESIPGGTQIAGSQVGEAFSNLGEADSTALCSYDHHFLPELRVGSSWYFLKAACAP